MTDNPKRPTTRRRFLKTAVAGAAVAAAAAGTANAYHPGRDRPAGRKGGKQYGMLIDVRRCVGCHSCTVACKAEFDVPLGMNRTWVEYVEKGSYPDAGRTFLPRLCNHCSVPQCVAVCPTGATYKRWQDGIVVVDSGVCIGCKYCIQACPYDARFLNPVTNFADKCDFCIHRVQKGLVPSCVNSCVGGARIFGDLSDPDSEISRLIARNRVTVLRSAMGTFPNVYYIDADHSDENDAHRPETRHVRVVTHRRSKTRK
jgi:tetrathionate reductase subunit B